MATARALRVILVGDISTGPYAGEIWQTGISFVEGDAGGVFAGAIKEGLPSFEVNTIGEATEDAYWKAFWAWEGVTKLSKANQTAIAEACKAAFEAIKGSVGTSYRLTEVRISAQDAAGKVINGANVFELKTPVIGTAATSGLMPAQMAVVASLRTGARGPGGRGRMYLPITGGRATDGVVGSATITAVLDAIEGLCEAVNAVGPVPAVVNAAVAQYSAIRTIECGNFYDVQRRRANARNEVYQTRTLTIA